MLRHGVVQYKVLHWVHWSKSKLSCIYPGTNPNCGKCHHGQSQSQFWSCPALGPFRLSVFDLLSEITSARIQPCPLTALFGVLPIGISLTSYFAFLTLLARRFILLHWRNRIRLSDAKFHKLWQPLIEHVRSLQLNFDPDVKKAPLPGTKLPYLSSTFQCTV